MVFLSRPAWPRHRHGSPLGDKKFRVKVNFRLAQTPNEGIDENESTMMRWVWLTICAILGLVMFLCGWLVPVHLRAVDANVINLAGRSAPSLVQAGLAFVDEKKLGAADMLLKIATAENLPEREKLGLAAGNFAMQHPGSLLWGGIAPRLESLFGTNPAIQSSGSVPFTAFVVRMDNREAVLAALRKSPRPVLQELLRLRALTNTAVFPPSPSASGQAFDTAVATCGLLLEGGHLTPELQEALAGLVAEANRSGNSQRIEQALLDLMSLGQRFNWGQLLAFAGRIEDTETLRLIAHEARKADDRLPQLFSAVVLSGTPAAVAKFLMNFSQTGLSDLGSSLRYGTGGLKELLRRNQRLYSPGFRQAVAGYDPFGAFYYFALDCCWLIPWVALALKWLLYLSAGFFTAAALHFARPAVSVLELPLQVRGFHMAREFLFALGFLLVVLLLSEPFLSQESQKVAYPFRLHLPMVGSAAPAGIARAPSSLMNQLSLLTLLLFFVLQALIYTACLIKLAEIRRQNIPPRIKLKLLDNEEHLFDAGLYLGFAGTIISLILVSMGVIKPSLMAAYSSTSFGIIFVSVFKIFHLRPLRRTMLLEAEGASAPSENPFGSSKIVLPP